MAYYVSQMLLDVVLMVETCLNLLWIGILSAKISPRILLFRPLSLPKHPPQIILLKALIVGKFCECRESNPEWLNEKLKRFLCAMPSSTKALLDNFLVTVGLKRLGLRSK